MIMTEQPLFDMTPREPLRPFDKVVVHTIWGDEVGEIMEVDHGLVEIATTSGDIIFIDPNRVEVLHG